MTVQWKLPTGVRSNLFAITRIHLDLVVAIEYVNERKHQMTSIDIDQQVNVQQIELILWIA